MKPLHLITAFIILLNCSFHIETHKQAIKVSIPFYFNFLTNHFSLKSISIKIYDAKGNKIFENKETKEYFELRYMKKIELSGKYRFHVIYYYDDKSKSEFEDFFEINGNEKRIDFTLFIGRNIKEYRNQVYINKYFDNIYNVQLKRLWDPQDQFNLGKGLIPKYEWTNTFDSIIYGIYRHYSRGSIIGEVHNDDVARIRFQRYSDTSWNFICNSGREIGAKLKKGETGLTIPDIFPSCANETFNKNSKYRIVIEYGINNEIKREKKANKKFESITYFENKIYQVTDEISIE